MFKVYSRAGLFVRSVIGYGLCDLSTDENKAKVFPENEAKEIARQLNETEESTNWDIR